MRRAWHSGSAPGPMHTLPCLHACRERHAAGAGASSSGRDQVQIRIDKFDLDNEVDDLRSHVGRIKQVCAAFNASPSSRDKCMISPLGAGSCHLPLAHTNLPPCRWL
jgi:hypothetical protein